MADFLKVSKSHKYNISIQWTSLILSQTRETEWRLVIKQNQQHIHPPLNDFIQIEIDSTGVNVSKIAQKMIYKEFARKKQTVPSTQKKKDIKYSGRLEEWQKIYSQARMNHLLILYTI